MSADQLAEIVTRDSMVGVTKIAAPARPDSKKKSAQL